MATRPTVISMIEAQRRRRRGRAAGKGAAARNAKGNTRTIGVRRAPTDGAVAITGRGQGRPLPALRPGRSDIAARHATLGTASRVAARGSAARASRTAFIARGASSR
jgi:hypothetical protein